MSFPFQLKLEKYDFFPLNRALSLSVMDEDSTESKVDDLLAFVMTLVERQKEEVSTESKVDDLLAFVMTLVKRQKEEVH